MKFGVRFALALFLPAAVLSGNQIVDSFNVGLTQAPNTDWGVTDIGWYYTPSTSYTLVQFLTEFTQSTAPGDINRVVTVGIFTNTPAAGGTLLGSATFNTSVARNTLGGATFTTGIPLTGGTTYFVGLENVLDLGVNEVTFSPNPAGPPGSVAPGATYQDLGGAQFGTQGSNGTTWFDKPVMEFLSPNATTTSTPEPGTFLLPMVPMALLLVRRLRLQ